MNIGRVIMLFCMFISCVLLVFPLKEGIKKIFVMENNRYFEIGVSFLLNLVCCVIAILFNNISHYFSIAGASFCAIST